MCLVLNKDLVLFSEKLYTKSSASDENIKKPIVFNNLVGNIKKNILKTISYKNAYFLGTLEKVSKINGKSG